MYTWALPEPHDTKTKHMYKKIQLKTPPPSPYKTLVFISLNSPSVKIASQHRLHSTNKLHTKY